MNSKQIVAAVVGMLMGAIALFLFEFGIAFGKNLSEHRTVHIVVGGQVIYWSVCLVVLAIARVSTAFK